MCAWRVCVSCDLAAAPSGGRGLMTSRPIGITFLIPLGIKGKWDNIFRMANLQVVATGNSLSA